MTYNQTLNKLLNIFGTLESDKQIPMAEKYSRLLVDRLKIKSFDGDAADSEPIFIRQTLHVAVTNLVRQAREVFKKNKIEGKSWLIRS